MTNTEERKCGECLMERTEIVQLRNGVCPKCGADYNDYNSPDKVSIKFLDKEWTQGWEKGQNCEMCQTGNAGLGQMMPIPTTRCLLTHGPDKSERWLCHSCITNGIKAGQLEAVNELPPNCPFSMG